MVRSMNLSGMTAQLAAHCSLSARSPGKIRLLLDKDGEHLCRPSVVEKLQSALSGALAEEIKLEFVNPEVDAVIDTPARRQQAIAADRQQAAAQAIHTDPNVKQMMDMFGAVVQPDSIKPVDSES